MSRFILVEKKESKILNSIKNFFYGCLMFYLSYSAMGIWDASLFGIIFFIFYLYPTSPFFIIPAYFIYGFMAMWYGHYIVKKSTFLQTQMYNALNHWFKKNSLNFVNMETIIQLRDQNCKYPRVLIGSHPHGVNACSSSLHGHLFPFFRKLGIRVFTHRQILFFPCGGFLARLIGLESIDRHNMKEVMSKNKKGLLLIVPGGGEEMVHHAPGKHVLYLKNRKGFVKYCLRFGYNLLPIYHFGDTELYDITFLTKYLPIGSPWRNFISLNIFFPFNILFIRGYKYIFWPVPKRKPIYSFVGEIIKIPQIRNPTDEELSKYHDLYIKKLIETREKGIEIMRKNPDEYKGAVFGKLKIV